MGLSRKHASKVSSNDFPREAIAPGDLDFEAEYPTLLPFLWEATWEDGSPRQTATLTLFVEDGMFKIALNDREASRSAYVSKDTFTEALAAVERKLKDDTLDWRPWSKQAKSRKGT